MTERILYDAGGHFDHRGTYHPHRPPATTTEHVDSGIDWRNALPPAPDPPTVTITTTPEPDWKRRTAKAEETADDLHVLALDWKARAEEADRQRAGCVRAYRELGDDLDYQRKRTAKAETEAWWWRERRNVAARHAVRLDDRVTEMGGQILAFECELCEKVEHIKGLEGELEAARAALGLHNEHWRELAQASLP